MKVRVILIGSLMLSGTLGASAQAPDNHDTLAYHLSTNAVAHANGFAGNSDDMMELSGWSYATYSKTNLWRLTNSVWSTNFWLHGVRGLSATCIGFSNSLAGQGLVTMVSPRHYLFAAHMHADGFLVAFLDTNNVIYWRKTLQRVDISNASMPDTSVGILNADLPPSVGFLPVAPSNILNYLPPSNDRFVQGIGMNQDMRLFGEPLLFSPRPVVGWNSFKFAPFGLATNWNVMIRAGDSSNPVMLLIHNQLVLVSHNYGVGLGPDYALGIDAINQGMHHLSTNNRVGSDYQLTPYSFANWPAAR